MLDVAIATAARAYISISPAEMAGSGSSRRSQWIAAATAATIPSPPPLPPPPPARTAGRVPTLNSLVVHPGGVAAACAAAIATSRAADTLKPTCHLERATATAKAAAAAALPPPGLLPSPSRPKQTRSSSSGGQLPNLCDLVAQADQNKSIQLDEIVQYRAGRRCGVARQTRHE